MLSHKALIEQISNIQSQSESSLREQLASLHHIMDFHGWGDLIVTHCSTRLGDNFLLAPYGLMFSEITKENLLEVDTKGNVLNKSDFRVNNNCSVSHCLSDFISL